MRVPLIKTPSAWVPMVLSLVVLATMLLFISLSGRPTRQADEGVGAHLFQIWFVLEAVMVVYFGTVWLPKKPGQALLVLVLQVVAIAAACTPVLYYRL